MVKFSVYLNRHISKKNACSKYIENFTTITRKDFQIKKSGIFHISAHVWLFRRGGSNEYPQSMFFSKIRKIMVTPVNYIKVGFKRFTLYRLVFVMHRTYITKTCLYNFDPLKPLFYVVKLGFTGYTLFFFSAHNIDCVTR